MSEILVTVVLAVHLLAVNVASAAPLVCIWMQRKAQRGNRLAGEIARQTAGASVTLLVVGLALGFATLGLMWMAGDERLFAAITQLPLRRYGWVLAEFVFSLVLLVAYVALWERLRERPFWHGLLAVLATTNLLYHFPPLMSILSIARTRPGLDGVVIDAAMYRSLLVDPEVLSRTIHFWLASIAVSGAFVLGKTLAAADADDEQARAEAKQVATGAAWIALVPTLLQLLVGTWVVLTLSSPARQAFLGEDLLGSGLLVLSILGSLALMHALAAVAMGEVSRQSIMRCMLLLGLVVVLMCGTLRRATIEATPGGRVVNDGGQPTASAVGYLLSAPPR